MLHLKPNTQATWRQLCLHGANRAQGATVYRQRGAIFPNLPTPAWATDVWGGGVGSARWAARHRWLVLIIVFFYSLADKSLTQAYVAVDKPLSGMILGLFRNVLAVSMVLCFYVMGVPGLIFLAIDLVAFGTR